MKTHIPKRIHATWPRALGAVALLALGACEAVPTAGRDRPNAHGEDGPLRAVVLTAATAGAAVSVRFSNSGGERYVFNPCVRTVERLVGESWERLPDELRLCTEEGHLLDAGSTVVKTTDVPSDVRPGSYRFRFRLWHDRTGGTTLDLVSEAFEVR